MKLLGRFGREVGKSAFGIIVWKSLKLECGGTSLSLVVSFYKYALGFVNFQNTEKATVPPNIILIHIYNLSPSTIPSTRNKLLIEGIFYPALWYWADLGLNSHRLYWALILIGKIFPEVSNSFAVLKGQCFLPELGDGLRRTLAGRSPKLEKANRDTNQPRSF